MRENALPLSINDITHASTLPRLFSYAVALLLHISYSVSTIPLSFAHFREKNAVLNENVYMFLIDFSFSVEPSLLNNSFPILCFFFFFFCGIFSRSANSVNDY